jgi:hypothetical protein
MTRPLKRVAISILLGCFSFVGGCATDHASTNQDLTVAAPVSSSALYPSCHGRTVRIRSRLQAHGSRVEALRVVVTDRDGASSAEAPDVRGISGARVEAVTTDGGAAVIWFASPGPCDGNCVTMTVTVPCGAPCPYRIRLVPVFKG